MLASIATIDRALYGSAGRPRFRGAVDGLLSVMRSVYLIPSQIGTKICIHAGSRSDDPDLNKSAQK